MSTISLLHSRIQQSTFWQRASSGMLWSLGGSVAARIFTLLASIIVSRHLGKEGFGELGIVQSTVSMFGEFAGAGVGLAATKFIAEYRDTRPGKAGQLLSMNLALAFAIGLAFAVGLHVFSNEIAAHLLGRVELGPLLKWGSVLLFFSTMFGAINGALAGFEQFRYVAYINIANGVLSLGLQVLMLRYFDIEGVVAALTITSGLTSACAFAALLRTMQLKGFRFDFKFGRENTRNIFTFNLPALLSALMVVPVNWACNLILVRQEGGFSEMGIFNAANQWKMALLFIPTTIGSVVLPILSNMIGTSDINGYRRILKTNLLINMLVSSVIVVVIFAASDLIMSKYGSDFAVGSQTLQILILVAGLMAVNNIVGHAITSTGDLWTGFGFNFAWAAALLISAQVLVPSKGALGLAYANLLAYALHTIWQFAFVQWRLRHGTVIR